MDLLDFEAQALYFDEEPDPEVMALIETAAQSYGSGAAERALLRAFFLAPKDLTVLVALYRYYYYQHCYADAFLVAERAMDVASERLKLRVGWRQLDQRALGAGVLTSMTLVRFYLMALKGTGFLQLRMGEIAAGLERLEKVQEVDVGDRMGVRELVEIARRQLRRDALQGHPNVVSL
jgi:hypothetical protein